MDNIVTTNLVSAFKCLQDTCPDTCCKGWSMQVDDATFAKYQKTGLEDAVSYDGTIRVMKRGAGDVCVKFEGGKCSIHARYGEQMLGDACNFYPRVTRRLGENTIMTATLSCPEITRLALTGELSYQTETTQRLPELKEYNLGEINAEDALIIHSHFLKEGVKPDVAAVINISRIFAVSESLANIAHKDWAGASGFMFKIADSKILPPESDANDALNIYIIFLGLIHATKKAISPRLTEVLQDIENMLGVTIEKSSMAISYKTPTPSAAENIDEALNGYLSAQLSFVTYPFAGIGQNITQKARILAYKYALTKLALKACPDKVKAIQSISRVIDHLADSALLINLLDQLNYTSHARIYGMLNI